ncbi:MAG: immunoglobulin domain-containing protein [Ilumatobacteraceae bacterium]
MDDGERATFRVVAGGSGPPTYEWLRDGVVIPGETSDELVVGPVTLADDGAAFQVRVTNGMGSVLSATASLTVRAASTGPSTIAYITGRLPLAGRELDIANHLSELGCAVTPIDDDRRPTLTGFDLVIVSSAVSPTTMADLDPALPVPILVWESYLFDDLRLSAAGSEDGGGSQTKVSVKLPQHPLAAGAAGTVTVVSKPGPLSLAKPGSDAEVVATSNTGRPTLFAYETGATLVDGTSALRATSASSSRIRQPGP